MAGFKLHSLEGKPSGFIANIQKNIRYMSVLGTRWDDKIIKQSKSVGITEAQEEAMYNIYGYQQFTGMDIGKKDFIAFFDKEYPTRRDFLRRFAMNGEIEHVLEIIADETVVYDENNFFAYPNTKNLKTILKQEKAKEIVDDLNECFKKIYYAFGFNSGHDGWHYLKKLLIDGFLAFEIIYDVDEKDNAKNVLGFKELDPVSLEPEMRKDEDQKDYMVWVQYRGDSKRQRELLDANLIYISWARGNFIGRLSYVERLVRAFNMLRTLENSRIIWNVINAQYRMKLIVPIGTQSEVKARTRLAELRGMFKEDITIEDASGEVTINGQPNFSFAKTYIFPSKEGTQTEIESFAPEGYNLSDTDALKYFWLRFVIETKVPSNRFTTSEDQSGGGANWGAGENITREELRFSNFINRIRSVFQEILLKPTWAQFCLKHPEFLKDEALKGAVGLQFVEENLFTKAKEREIAGKGADTVSTMSSVQQQTIAPDGTITEEPYFDPKFLVEKYMDFTDLDLMLNDKYKKERKSEMKKMALIYKRIGTITGEPGAGAGGEMGGGEMGGLAPEAGGEMGGLAPEAGGETPPEGEPGGGEVDLGL